MDEMQRWARIEEAFHRALELPVEERDAFVRLTCAGDAELEARVRSLLDAEEAAGDFLATPVARVGEPQPGDAVAPSIGPYRLVRPLGSGGMGEVFLGLQETPDFKRFAAIKVMRGGVDPGFSERFTRERAILAQLAHPGIARFLGGGTTDDGRPYYVMEHVEGERIDHYADRRLLSIRERVELVRQACAAVAHAHSNLVVHRDLKPSNILVTAEGLPILLDFGIAKLLTDERPDITRTGLQVATPEYAAPEQLRGDPISTATDVYALGVLLYELLSGHRPHTAAEAAALAIADDPPTPRLPSVRVGQFGTRRTSLEEEETITPEDVSAKRRADPGALRRSLRGDLDNIVLRALRADPRERYLSAAALADDLERYLTGQPVRARADSLTYRLTKFIRRNRAASLAAAALLLTLIGATLATWSQNRQIRAQAEQLSTERDRAVEVQGFLLESFSAAGGEDEEGATVTVRQMLDAQADRMDALYEDDPDTRTAMQLVLADGYERIGALEQAEAWARRALGTQRAQVSEAVGPQGIESELARTTGLLGWIRHEQGDFNEAEGLLRESLAGWRSIGTDSVGLARALNDLGVVLTSQAQWEEAEAVTREALAIRRVIYPETDRALGITTNNLAGIVGQQGDRAAALEIQQEASRLLEVAMGPEHLRTLRSRRNVATWHAWLGEWERSLGVNRDLTATFRTLGQPARIDLIRSLEGEAVALGQMGRFAEADSTLRIALATAEEVLGNHPMTASLLGQLMGLNQRIGDRGTALEFARRSVDMMAVVHDDHPSRATALRRLGALATERGEQLRSFRASMDMFARLEGTAGPGTVRSAISLARALQADGRHQEALGLFEQLAKTVPVAYGSDHPYAVAPALGQAEAHAALGNAAEAERALAEARDAMTGSADVPPNQQWLASAAEAVSNVRGGGVDLD